MADIIINISGSAAAAESSVTSLIGKLQELSNTLDSIGTKVRSAFKGFGQISTRSMESFSDRLSEIETKLDSLSGKTVNVNLREFTEQANSSARSLSKSAGFFDKFTKSIGRIAFYRLLRTVLKEVSEAFQEGLQNAYAFSKLHGGPLAQAIDSISASASQMKNQLGAAFGGLITEIAPIVEAVISLITRLADALTQLFALLGGSVVYKKATAGMNSVAKAAGGGGSAIKGMLAAWDELKVIGNSGGGGGGGSTDASGLFEYADISESLMNKWKELGLDKSIERFKAQFDKLVNSEGWAQLGDIAQTLGLDLLKLAIDGVTDALKLLNDILNNDWKASASDLFLLVSDATINGVLTISDALEGLINLFGGNVDFSEFRQTLLDVQTILRLGEDVEAASEAWARSGENIKKLRDELKAFLMVVGGIGTGGPGALFPVLTDWLFNLGASVKEIPGDFQEAWGEIANIWNSAPKWFSQNVLEPIKSVFSRSLLWIIENAVEPFAISFAEAFDALKYGSDVVFWGIKAAAAGAINGAIGLLNGLIDAMNTVGPIMAQITGDVWEDIAKIEPISVESFDTVKEKSSECADAVRQAFSGLKDTLTNELSANPVITYTYKNAPSTIGSQNAKFTTTISAYASGGEPSTGELFLARESGPELVGRVGNRTAVANNDQIVQMVQESVVNANAQQNELIRQGLVLLGQIARKELVVTPTVALGQTVNRAVAMASRA